MRAPEDSGLDRVYKHTRGMAALGQLACPSGQQCLLAATGGCMQIDMDTIETSNLNRQFLFRKHHVGESKAKIAADSVRRFRPNARIQADQVLLRCSIACDTLQM